MIEFLTYDLKVAVLLAVFYMFYRLLLARETFHHVNRLVLLTTAVASFVLPLCVITFHETVTMQAVANVSVGDIQVGVMDEEPSTPWWQIALPILYILGVMATLGYTLWSLFRILSLIRHSERHPQADGITICVTDNAEMAPFSWMHYIVMNRDDFEISDSAILAHERGHIRLHHSWDLILVDTLTALQWFNPAMWMLRSDLRTIHEYEADGAVLSQGINARQYQYLLITKAAGIGGYSLANGISHSTLKNRINMMLHKKSPRQSYLKLLALLPIVAVALALNAETVTDVVYQQPQKKMVKKGKKNATIKMGSTNDIMVIEQPPAPQEKVEPVEMPNALEVEKQDGAFDVVEEMPQYPGGPKALFEFLSNTVNYPEEAEKAGTQGRVIATFVVEKDGSISGAKVVKSVDPLLDAEALRVINAMPNWTPGKQNGKVVRVKYTVPISFNLDGGKDRAGNIQIIDEKSAAYLAGSSAAKNGLPPSLETVIYVDGKEVSHDELGKIKSESVDHIDVLKDKAAIDKYGEKAKNGVILITTKKN